MQGMASPFYIVFPSFDTKYVHWFSKREQLHDNLSKLMENMDEIIEKKRKLVYENVQGESKEKDLLTLMIESELKSEGESLSNEELRVSKEDENRMRHLFDPDRAISVFSF